MRVIRIIKPGSKVYSKVYKEWGFIVAAYVDMSWCVRYQLVLSSQRGINNADKVSTDAEFSKHQNKYIDVLAPEYLGLTATAIESGYKGTVVLLEYNHVGYLHCVLQAPVNKKDSVLPALISTSPLDLKFEKPVKGKLVHNLVLANTQKETNK